MEITPLNYLSEYLHRFIRGRLWLKVLIGLVLGIFVGALLNESSGLIDSEVSFLLSNWLEFPSNIFIRLVQMVMIPLVLTSIITGIVSNSSEKLRTIGTRLALYFIATTIISILIGIAVSLLMQPGKLMHAAGGLPGQSSVRPEGIKEGGVGFENLPDAISGLIPNNPFQSLLTGEMLAIVVFAIIIGIAIMQLTGSYRLSVLRIVQAIQKICMIVIAWAMALVPYAVFGLMASLMAQIGFDALVGLTYYMGVVVIGLVILLLVYLLILVALTRSNPMIFLKAVKEPQLLAFSMASSAAVMPLSMKVADEKLHVSSNISDLVIPVGATINMDGTALFQCVTALFITQAYGIELSMPGLILLTSTVVGASIGTPSIPGGGVMVLASVLSSMGIPTDAVVIIIGVDRMLGMFRTTINVTGDLVASVVFNKWFGATALGSKTTPPQS